MGSNDAARAARFAWMFATHAGPVRVESKQLRDSLSGAHVAAFQNGRSGEARRPSSIGRARALAGATDAHVIGTTAAETVTKLALNDAGTARFISNLCREGVKPEPNAPRAVGMD